MDAVVYRTMILFGIFHSTLQHCPKETSTRGISVTWHETSTAYNIESDPQCYRNETLITRNCSNSNWTPALNELAPCLKVVKYLDLSSCPPGFNKVTEENNGYCYQLGRSSTWDFPCFTNGGASIITDLSATEVSYLIKSLRATNVSRYFWIPAQRQKFLQHVMWTIPGPNWGQRVQPNSHLRLQAHFTKHCLTLDIEQNMLVTDICTRQYPSLCFYIKDPHYPAKCPPDYHSFRFTPDNNACYGIAKSGTPQGMTFNDFLNGTCNKPMSNDKDISTFIFKKIAEMAKLPTDVWCWFGTDSNNFSQTVQLSRFNTRSIEGIINNAGVMSIMNISSSLPCMACEAEVVYGETELMIEYNDIQNQIYLTVYHPSGLWKYNEQDKGIQCFSDAKGFVRVVDINDNPFIDFRPLQPDSELGQIEKIVYVIDPVTNSSAQYWCEGHTPNFSLIATDKMIVNPRGNKIHVFSLVIKHYITIDEVENISNIVSLVDNITVIFAANKVLLMDVFNYTSNHIFILLHLHVTVEDIHENKAFSIQETFNSLKSIAESQLSEYNITFVNLSSSVYCLPTSSMDVIELDWDMTPIGHISAPNQFCLQSNGLPVKRHCEGSYMLGGTWGDVEGYCDGTYEPSTATALLYNFVKGPNNYVSQFLTEGLSYVLGDTDIIIPADIYYLSMSLQQISGIAQENVTSIDSADLNHIAWVMDRVMILDCEYLRLAQTLNSTNVIVDSISDIIEIIANKNFNETSESSNVSLQMAVEPQFVVQITYPDSNNITGIAVINNTTSHNFTDMLIYPLYKNTTLDDVLSIQNLEIAAWLPTNILESLQLCNNSDNATDQNHNLHIIITIYRSDAVFQELQEKNHIVNSRIIGVSIPNYITNLEYPIPVLFKPINHTISSFCGYWDFHHQQSSDFPGSWKKHGCNKVKSVNDITVCECYHLTHFGQLFFHNERDKEKNHAAALNVITLVGSFLSLVGIIGIWVTALIFSNWRKKPGTKVLLQLSTAIALPLLFIVIFNLHYSMFIDTSGLYTIAPRMKLPCVVLGALLHFSILASFMWMLITGVLQFIRYVRVLGVRRPARFMFKFTLIGWGIPLLPVVITLALDYDTYVPAPSLNRKICYPSGNYLIATVLAPICIILLINITLFILVLHAISRGSNLKMKATDMDLVGAQLRVSIFLFFLLGLTWVFGIFSFSGHLIWSYLFCLTSSIQGFVLFIYFVICDPSTRGLWVTLMKPQFTTNSSRNSVSSISTE